MTDSCLQAGCPEIKYGSASRRRTAGRARPRRADIGTGHAAWGPVPARARPAVTGRPRRPPYRAPAVPNHTRRPGYALPPLRPPAQPLRGPFGVPSALRRPSPLCAFITHSGFAGKDRAAAPLPVLAPGGTALRVGLPSNSTRPGGHGHSMVRCGGTTTGKVAPPHRLSEGQR